MFFLGMPAEGNFTVGYDELQTCTERQQCVAEASDWADIHYKKQ